MREIIHCEKRQGRGSLEWKGHHLCLEFLLKRKLERECVDTDYNWKDNLQIFPLINELCVKEDKLNQSDVTRLINEATDTEFLKNITKIK